MRSPSGHPRWRWVCFFIRFVEMCLCIRVSATDALQWMGAVRMRVQTADKNITIIHTTPVYQLTSGEDKKRFLLWKKCISCCLFHQNPFLSWFRPEHVFTVRSIIIDYRLCILVKNVLMLDLFYLLSSPDVNWWTVDYCDVFIRLSFWRHPFTAEHPLLRHWCSDTFLQIWWRNKLIYVSDGLRVKISSAN